MKIKFLIFETKAPAWVVEGRDEYSKKLSAFLPFEVQTLKSPSAERDSKEVKRRREGELLLQQFDERDYVILFDEAGKLENSSETLAQSFARVIESGKARAIFCIGGPYGFADEVKARAQSRWSLSRLTMNHWLAQLVALEQIYRSFTILKGLPYHNR